MERSMPSSPAAPCVTRGPAAIQERAEAQTTASRPARTRVMEASLKEMCTKRDCKCRWRCGSPGIRCTRRNPDHRFGLVLNPAILSHREPSWNKMAANDSMKTQRTIVIIGVILTLLGLAAMRRARVRTALGLPPVVRTGTIFGSLDFGGRTRNYLVHPPRGYAPGAPLPVVFVLHGASESNDSVEELSRMSGKADAEHFVAVYPAGTGRVVTWNAGACCGGAMKEKVDDVGFLRVLLEKIEREYAIDPKRVYFTGISNGAMMAYRVACEMAEQVAAIAPVEGALNVECHPTAPVAVLIFHGTADRIVPFEGGANGFEIDEGRRDNSVAGAVSFWAKRDGCA